MVLNPEVQKRAQAEIDRVVGTDRLPDFGDRVSIPYVEAVLRETMRFHPIAPLGKVLASVQSAVP
jgi:cytochrome P450